MSPEPVFRPPPLDPRDLRFLLWGLLLDGRVWTVPALVAALEGDGVAIGGSPGKRVVDSLRHHRRRGVVRLGPGRYRFESRGLPRSTRYRYAAEARRVRARLRAEAAAA